MLYNGQIHNGEHEKLVDYTKPKLYKRVINIETNIKGGILRGDSLSPLLFCLALAPLSCLLNNSRLQIQITQWQTESPILYCS